MIKEMGNAAKTSDLINLSAIINPHTTYCIPSPHRRDLWEPNNMMDGLGMTVWLYAPEMGSP